MGWEEKEQEGHWRGQKPAVCCGRGREEAENTREGDPRWSDVTEGAGRVGGQASCPTLPPSPSAQWAACEVETPGESLSRREGAPLVAYGTGRSPSPARLPDPRGAPGGPRLRECWGVGGMPARRGPRRLLPGACCHPMSSPCCPHGRQGQKGRRQWEAAVQSHPCHSAGAGPRCWGPSGAQTSPPTPAAPGCRARERSQSDRLPTGTWFPYRSTCWSLLVPTVS